SQRGLQIDPGQGSIYSIPLMSTSANADFVQELAPIPVEQNTSNSLVLSLKKIASISTYTRELLDHSTPTIEAVVGSAMSSAISLTIDSKAFDATAGDDIRPAGLLHGIGATSASSNTDLNEAMHEDLAALIAAVAGVAGPNPIVFICAPAQGRRVKMRMLGKDPGFDIL